MFTQPLDVLKTRAMNAKQGDFKGPLDLIRFTASQGPMAFFKGMYFLIVWYGRDRNHPKNGLKENEQGFSSYFCQIFGIFGDYSMLCSAFSTHHFEKSSNMLKFWQKIKKSLVALALNLCLRSSSKIRNPRFG